MILGLLRWIVIPVSLLVLIAEMQVWLVYRGREKVEYSARFGHIMLESRNISNCLITYRDTLELPQTGEIITKEETDWRIRFLLNQLGSEFFGHFNVGVPIEENERLGFVSFGRFHHDIGLVENSKYHSIEFPFQFPEHIVFEGAYKRRLVPQLARSMRAGRNITLYGVYWEIPEGTVWATDGEMRKAHMFEGIDSNHIWRPYEAYDGKGLGLEVRNAKNSEKFYQSIFEFKRDYNRVKIMLADPSGHDIIAFDDEKKLKKGEKLKDKHGLRYIAIELLDSNYFLPLEERSVDVPKCSRILNHFIIKKLGGRPFYSRVFGGLLGPLASNVVNEISEKAKSFLFGIVPKSERFIPLYYGPVQLPEREGGQHAVYFRDRDGYLIQVYCDMKKIVDR